MNPFIALYQDPVGVLIALGYVLGLLTLVILTLAATWDNALTVYVQADNNWHRWNYSPPATWLLRVAAIPFVLAIDAWAVGALIWLVF